MNHTQPHNQTLGTCPNCQAPLRIIAGSPSDNRHSRQNGAGWSMFANGADSEAARGKWMVKSESKPAHKMTIEEKLMATAAPIAGGLLAGMFALLVLAYVVPSMLNIQLIAAGALVATGAGILIDKLLQRYSMSVSHHEMGDDSKAVRPAMAATAPLPPVPIVVPDEVQETPLDWMALPAWATVDLVVAVARACLIERVNFSQRGLKAAFQNAGISGDYPAQFSELQKAFIRARLLVPKGNSPNAGYGQSEALKAWFRRVLKWAREHYQFMY